MIGSDSVQTLLFYLGPMTNHLTRLKPVPMTDVGGRVYGYSVWEKEIKMIERIWQGLREGGILQQVQ